jgi:hypothetical protein
LQARAVEVKKALYQRLDSVITQLTRMACVQALELNIFN